MGVLRESGAGSGVNGVTLFVGTEDDAEPEGRALVVVTSDRAVVDSVRRRGAHPVPSSVLLARLARI